MVLQRIQDRRIKGKFAVKAGLHLNIHNEAQ